MTQNVVILGAGVVGVAIAYELSLRPEFHVTLLDTQPPAQGSTGAALGVLMGIISRKTKGRAWQLRRRSMIRFPELLQELEQAGCPVPHNPDGILKLFDAETDVSKLENLQQKRHDGGWQLELWDQGNINETCPQITENICAGAVYSPEDFQVQPVPFVQALLEVAQQKGIETAFEIESPKLNFDGGNCVSVTAGDRLFSCDWLIISAGLGSLEITKPLLADFQMKPVLGQAFHGKIPNYQAPDFQPVVSYNDVHVVPLGDGEFWVGATVEFPDDEGNLAADQDLAQKVWEAAIAFYPALENAEILRHWSGQRPRPEGQGAPVIQPLQGYQNILLATGHYRNGVLLAPATALKICDWLLAPETIPR
ncbi:NAD(P)/FAD-dependent oxidoreductase [[Limnothrix rosea] IAM M-220]|uniref:NAD(P)/FAD-dependent oxidoreductase n=1 Tax=[Limnothrix rosea] IAM M-220 TaxID=454133 RepID=UPI0009602FF0|nr:FAD-dependent oxidoreductase [[Limnothrix rosea] IAM M-220]OKH19911.1 FAD-dependent oxidoreductase [[Limnothrix rosea] IAM M-220]